MGPLFIPSAPSTQHYLLSSYMTVNIEFLLAPFSYSSVTVRFTVSLPTKKAPLLLIGARVR